MAKFCNKCGAPLGGIFCVKCGADSRLAASSQPQTRAGSTCDVPSFDTPGSDTPGSDTSNSDTRASADGAGDPRSCYVPGFACGASSGPVAASCVHERESPGRQVL